MRTRALLAPALLVAAAAGVASAQQPAGTHVIKAGKEIVWGPAPPVLKAGAQFAVVAGDPGQPGPYVVRLKVPAGYVIAPHFHPTDENVTVISGTFALGMGDKLDAKAAKDLPAGGFALMPAQMHHYAVARTAVVVQVHGTGPFQITYVNPADDPSQAKK
jgi:quercetin dioxygenase-like cupin family protein